MNSNSLCNEFRFNPLSMPYRRTESVEARLADNRVRIVEATLQVVSETGWREASIVAIASAAGLATGSIYRYFPSRTDLFIEAYHTVSAHLRGLVEQVLAGDGPALERLQAAVALISMRSLRGARLSYAMIAEPVEAAVEEVRLEYRAAFAQAFEALLAEGVARGEIPPQNTSVAAACLVGAFFGAIAGPIAPEHAHTETAAEQFTADVVAACLRLVGAPPPT
jgi:AcrR family transcriptional regulator